MFTYKYIVAAALLTSPPSDQDIPDAAAVHAFLGSAVQEIALHWELLDAREMRFLGYHAQDFAADLKVLQGRKQELDRAPLIEECNRFPDRTLISDLMAFNRSYRNDLAARMELDKLHAEELRTAIQETDHLHRIWEKLRDARCEFYYLTVRRQALLELRELIGAAAFYSGQLPPHVPTWRFPEH